MENKILDEIVSNSKKLMKCVTIKDNYKEFDKTFDIVKKELKDYNIKEVIVNNYPNIIITNTKSKKLDVIFCCHMDVVPNDTYEPIQEGNILKGRGSFDMKSQLSVVMSLLKNNKSDKKIAFIITSDEEIGGQCCKEVIKDYDSNLAVIPDAGKDFKLITEEKGLLQVEIKVKGVSSHASSPFEGVNAIVKAMDIYKNLLKIYPMPKNESDFKTSVNLSKLHGGDTNNKVCDEATMFLDIRFNKDTNKERLLNDIKKVAQDSEIKVVDYGPMFYVDKELPIMQDFIKNASSILKEDLVISKCLATSDAIYFSEKNIPTIMINPIGDFWHHPSEYVEIDSLYTLYELFKTLI